MYDTLYFANSIIERVRSRAQLKTFSDTEASCKSFYRSTYISLNIWKDDLLREGSQLGEKIGFERGIRKGRRDGIAAGAYQAKRETAKLMQRESCSVDFIQRMTGLSETEIEKL